ncbi:MAG: sigma factor-like helix-turn-helix DNA-binding protein, partial [Thermoleophilaceae bacterium]
MATFDQLSDEQRAIVELVLRQGKSYGELSDMLGLPEVRVRELARDALVDLAPITARGVEQDWRGQLADYVLGFALLESSAEGCRARFAVDRRVQ